MDMIHSLIHNPKSELVNCFPSESFTGTQMQTFYLREWNGVMDASRQLNWIAKSGKMFDSKQRRNLKV